MLVATLVALVSIAVTVVAVGAVVSVPVVGASMEPTLRDGDRLVVGGSTQPGRFALAVLRFDDTTPAVVKRVVGLPGDQVRIDPGPVVLVRPGGTGEWQRVDNPAWIGRWTRPSTTAEATVPSGELFVLGDNPDASEDSRQLGSAPARLVQGTVRLRVYPLSRLGAVPGEVTLRPWTAGP